MLLHNSREFFNIPAGINESAFQRFFAPDNAAVLLEGCYGYAGIFHARIITGNLPMGSLLPNEIGIRYA